MSEPKRIHIVGIGGAGMSGLARLLLAAGEVVSGSDAKESKRLTALAAEGIKTYVGHSADHVVAPDGEPLVDLVAASTAVPQSNPELQAAHAAGITVWSRADLLCHITDPYDVISVGGTHGKTTTTSMLAVALQAAGHDPSFAIGSELSEQGSNAHLASGSEFVVEADESDGTFLRLATKYAIVTNVEPDHLNYWKDFAALEQAFIDFASGVQVRDGAAIVCVDDEGAAKLVAPAQAAGAKVVTYGQSDSADYRVELGEHGKLGWNFELAHGGEALATISLSVPGIHNVLNASAALVCAHLLGADLQLAVHGLQSFRGARRRFDFRGEADGVRVFDDYAHHPTEIAATLRAAREVAGSGKVVVAFEAHHYYRTALFSKEFGQALGLADEVVVMEVFAPGEEFIEGASGSQMAANVTLPSDQVQFVPSWSAVPAALVGRARPGDIIMTLGAGEIGTMCPDIVRLLAEREADSGNH